MTLFFEFFTTGAGWVFATLLLAVLAAVTVLINQYLKFPGNLLVFWSRIMIVAVMTPLMYFIDWPSNPIFYLAVAATGVGAGFADVRLYNVVAKHGGGVVARSLPFVIFITFPLWFLFDHELFFKYIDQPFITLGIICVLSGVGFFASNLKKCEVSKVAVKALMPSLITYAIIDLLSKYAMQLGSYEGVVFCYLYVQSVVVIPIIGGHLFVNREKFKKTFIYDHKKIIGASAGLAFLWIVAMIFKNTAMISVPNPAYLSAMTQLSPVLISIFYYIVKHKEEGDVASGFGIVVCAILLSLLVI